MPQTARAPVLVSSARPTAPIFKPLYRPLKAYAFDPGRGKTFGNYMTLHIPYEDLTHGPVGNYVAVVDYDAANKCYYEPVNLDDSDILIRGGLDPSESDPRFHQQMVYAVVSETIRRFEFALGRRIHWRTDRSRKGLPFHSKLRIFPHAMQEANAYYDPALRALLFGYFPASETDPGNNLPGQTIFTCLSHDIVAHEATHALIDGIRAYFMEPTSPDTPAFHEAFADVVALFQHFSMKEALLEALRGTRGLLQRISIEPDAKPASTGPSISGELARDNPLVSLAKQFGDAIGMHAGLRSALGTPPNSSELEKQFEPHARGSILVAAIFDAFLTIYVRRTRDLLRIAGIDSASLGADLHPDLLARLASEASKIAEQFENICIRALDYCPPLDIRFGDFLRAMITADYDLVRDDDLGYRAALIDAFRSRGIQPSDVISYSEESLLWCGPETLTGQVIQCQGLHTFIPPYATPEEVRKIQEDNAKKIHDFAENNKDVFGLVPDVPIEVPSFHPLHRVGPDGQLNFEMVAEVIQTQKTKLPSGDGPGLETPIRGGAILLFDTDGTVRYAIRKSLKRQDRIEGQRAYNYQLWENAAMAAYGNDKINGMDFRAIHRGF